MSILYEKLLNYSKSDYYGFHMPGHKRNKNLADCNLPYDIDITEIEGFDDLHHAKGIIKAAEVRAAVLYQAEETHFLINGSTSGILSAIMGCTSRGDKVLIARNCHKSVYHALQLKELRPVYIYPGFYTDLELNGPVCASDIERALELEQDVKAVVITSPSYDGVVSDVRAIAQMVHSRKIPLIVDEAHGAHFGLHPYFPQNSNVMGADVVIHSLHKTLPALTQAALIHMNGSLVPRREIRQYLQMLQTSSPSYVIMASMDVCIDLLGTRGWEYFKKYTEILDGCRQRLSTLNHLKLLETANYDRSKIIISVKGTNITSIELYKKLLETYHLQMEMAAGSYVLAMTSIGDTKDGMERLADALTEIDSQLIQLDAYMLKYSLPELKQRYTSAELEKLIQIKNRDNAYIKTLCTPKSPGTKFVDWNKAQGRISAEYAYIYPPGIPLFVPGEELTKEAMLLLKQYETLGFSIEGLKNHRKVEVLDFG